MEHLNRFPPVRFESIVSAVIICPQTGKILTARMHPEAKNQLASERHFPGGEVRYNESPEIALRLRLNDKLCLTGSFEIRPFIVTHREGTWTEPRAPDGFGLRYITTYWYLIGLPASFDISSICIPGDTDLVPGTEAWASFHDLIDDQYPDSLGKVALSRTPIDKLAASFSRNS